MKFLLTADWHICGEQPPCRVGDWIEIQRQNVRFVVDYANKHKLPIFHTGDIFDRSRCSTEALNMLLKELSRLKQEFHLLAGNHDLLSHSYENVDHSSIGVLYNTGMAIRLHNDLDDSLGFCAFPFGMDKDNGAEIRFIHKLVFPDEKSRPIEDCGLTAQELLDLYPQQAWIFTGDYHHKFHYENNGRHVVTPGCLNIQKSDMADYDPCFAVVDTDYSTVAWISVPFDENSVDISYNTTKKERDERFQCFVEKISSSKQALSLSFWDNLEVASSAVSDRVAKVITKVKEKVKNDRESK